MNAVSPFSIPSSLSPAAHVLGTLAGDIAESARGKGGLAGAFSDAFTGLDANDDGRLNASDVLGHGLGLRNAVLGGIADVFGVEQDPAKAGAGASDAMPHGAGPATTSAAQMMIASAPPALPSAAAARALENLPGIADIRAAYAALGAAQ
jgi:hypothetical protein